jgi:sulfotransferase family protein
MFFQSLRPEELIEWARRRTRLADFGEAPFQEGLDRFLRACTEEADLSLFGRLGTRWDMGRLLSNLLRLRAEELRTPEILEEPIEQPIFITGLPRSGTTFLHQLLAADEANQVPRVWQLIHPYPVHGSGNDRRRLRVARQLRMFQVLSPGFRQMHPIGADSPQECSEITAHIFASPRFDTTYTVPSYRRWLDGNDHIDAFRFHRRFLQHLQHQTGYSRRWVLKCPDHVFALAGIQAVYPDARFVFVHRDPLRVMSSVARLTEVLRRPFTRRVDRAALGRQECERWSLGTELMIRAADEEPFAEAIFHIHYSELVSNPLGALKRLYHHFGLPLESDAAANIYRTVEAKPDGGHRANRYSFADYGIDADEIREQFAHYMARFGTRPEPDRGSREPPVLTTSAELLTEPGE